MKTRQLLGVFGAGLLAALVMGAAATRNKYVGAFVGDGSGLTNTAASGGSSTVAAYVSAATLTNKVQASNIVAGGVLPVLNAGNLTNIITTSTNAFSATWATNWTSGNIIEFLTVQAMTDRTAGTFRRAAGQTNNIVEVQDQSNNKLLSVGPGGTLHLTTNLLASWPTTPDTGGGCALVNSNGTLYALTSLPFTKTWAATNKLAP